MFTDDQYRPHDSPAGVPGALISYVSLRIYNIVFSVIYQYPFCSPTSDSLLKSP
jgi:hypothetical protein